MRLLPPRRVRVGKCVAGTMRTDTSRGREREREREREWCCGRPLLGILKATYCAVPEIGTRFTRQILPGRKTKYVPFKGQIYTSFSETRVCPTLTQTVRFSKKVSEASKSGTVTISEEVDAGTSTSRSISETLSVVATLIWSSSRANGSEASSGALTAPQASAGPKTPEIAPAEF